MKRKLSIGVLLFFLLGVFLTGCTAKDPNADDKNDTPGQETPVVDEGKQKALMEQFDSIAVEGADIAAVVDFIDENISQATGENASKMILRLEKLQKEYLPVLGPKFYDNQNIQTKMIEVYTNGFDINKIYEIKDEEIKALLTEASNAGYKIETAEGTFYPVIDYQFYKKYSSSVTPDIKDYIDLMAVESDAPPAKDAAFVISWDEVMKRALGWEKFIVAHGDSAKINDAREQYAKYVTFALLGVNNTPAFSYDGDKLNTEAREAYNKIAADAGDSKFKKTIQDFLVVLEKNNYTLTDEVNKFRENARKEFEQ